MWESFFSPPRIKAIGGFPPQHGQGCFSFFSRAECPPSCVITPGRLHGNRSTGPPAHVLFFYPRVFLFEHQSRCRCTEPATASFLSPPRLHPPFFLLPQPGNCPQTLDLHQSPLLFRDDPGTPLSLPEMLCGCQGLGPAFSPLLSEATALFPFSSSRHWPLRKRDIIGSLPRSRRLFPFSPLFSYPSKTRISQAFTRRTIRRSFFFFSAPIPDAFLFFFFPRHAQVNKTRAQAIFSSHRKKHPFPFFFLLRGTVHPESFGNVKETAPPFFLFLLFSAERHSFFERVVFFFSAAL